LGKLSAKKTLSGADRESPLHSRENREVIPRQKKTRMPRSKVVDLRGGEQPTMDGKGRKNFLSQGKEG